MTLGVGLGNAYDLEPFGEVVDPRVRGLLLDEGLDRLGLRRWEAAGATWVLTSMDPQPPQPEVRAVVDAGP
jgi:hypothetical protein